MILYYTHRTKEVVDKLGWMQLRWKKISSVSDLGNIQMEFLEEALLVLTDREKRELESRNTCRGHNVPNPYYICVSAEEILREEDGEVVGLPQRLRGCTPHQLFDGVYRREGI